MIRVQTPSRLHFGLLGFESDGSLPAARRFGSVGLMVEEPGVLIEAAPASAWSAEGPLAERALAFARRFSQSVPAEAVRPLHLRVARSAPEHCGLGTGTQLALAVARVAAGLWGVTGLNAVELAERVGRGRRSALGIHGFDRGGFLVDGGKRTAEGMAPLVARMDFPAEWRVVLALSEGKRGLHGEAERDAFGRLASLPMAAGVTERLCRLVLLGMLPALAEQDLDAFGDALFAFNSEVGRAFAPVQGGVYASARVAELVDFIRRQGVRGVGQSSWGPAVFAVTDLDRAEALARLIRHRFGPAQAEVVVTRGCNRGALVGSPLFEARGTER